MAFASVHVPNFLLQAVVRAEPDLRGRALALVEGDPPLWKIVAADEGALQAGIELGMGGSQARQFSSVEIRRRAPELEISAHAALLDAGWSISPRVEAVAPGTLVLDLAGLTSLFKSVKKLALALAERAAGIGLRPRIAVASNIEAAILAARGFPGITLIPPGREAEHLSSLPVETLLPSAETLEILQRWGIRTCGDLAQLPLLPLSERLGQEGVRLHEQARGAHHRALTLAQPQISFEEEMALDSAITELEPLSFLLGRLLHQLCARLEARSLAASAFRLRFDLQDLEEQDDFPETQKHSASREAKTYEAILRLPVPMRDPATLLKLLRLHLQADPPHGSIRKIFLTAEPGRPRAGQKGLFIPDSPDPEKLEVTIARLAALVGNSNVGSPQPVDTHRPGEFRMAPFVSIPEEARPVRTPASAGPASHGGEGGGTLERKSRRTVIAFRMFRPEAPAHVELQEGRPCRIAFRGARGEVAAASGPWRTSGDWWDERGWRQDEWDAEIRFASPGGKSSSRAKTQNGIYRIYYDWTRHNWFVRGRYD
jgi:protein ImuB